MFNFLACFYTSHITLHHTLQTTLYSLYNTPHTHFLYHHYIYILCSHVLGFQDAIVAPTLYYITHYTHTKPRYITHYTTSHTIHTLNHATSHTILHHTLYYITHYTHTKPRYITHYTTSHTLLHHTLYTH
jgi:hypothetical protein